MKNNIIKRVVSLLLALVCVMGVLPLSAFAAEGPSSAPAYITQKSADYWRTNGRLVRYQSANSTINNTGSGHVFDAQVTVPGLPGTTRALCSHHAGALGSQANGQKWNYRQAVDNVSLKVLLTYVYSHTNGHFTDAGKARGLSTWGEFWADLWFITAQTMTWYWEYGLIKDVITDREGFIEQASEEMITSFKVLHDVWNYSPWIKDWDSVTIHTIIDSKDNGKTGNSAYDYIRTGVDLVLDHPEYYYNYNLWEFDWDKSQSWKLTGQSGVPMQRLLIAVPDEQQEEIGVKLTVKKLEAGTNKPISGVTFKVEGMDEGSDFSVTKTTGTDGTFTLTSETDGLTAGQYTITEEAAPEGYVARTESQTVTVLPNGSVANTFTFFNEPGGGDGEGTIRKVDKDNPTVGIPGAVIRITSVKLDDDGGFFGEYVTGDGGYIPKEDLDFANLPKGSYLAEEITPPEGFVLSSDVSKVRQPFVWDGEHDVSLVFENSAKVKIQLKKVDESSSPLPGAVFLILRDGQVIGTEETKADGAITVSNITEGYYEFVEVAAPTGMDCDKTPVGVHVNAEDLQGEQTITVTKVNHHKRSLTIQKRDAESGLPVPGTSFHVHGVNLGYENDVVTGADGKAVLEALPSGCYEIEETDVPAPYLLDTNNRKTVWIDSEKDKDIVVDFVNSTKPGLRLLKIDQQTGEPLSGVLFRVAEVNGGYDEQHFTDQNGLIVLEGLNPGAYTVQEVKPKNGWVADDTVHTIYLEENKTTTLELSNLRKPDLFIKKVDSITGSPIEGVKFQIWRGSDDTNTGEYNDLGTFYTDAEGQIHLERQETGWYKVKELETAPGFTIRQPDTQEIYLAAGKDHTVTFENTPKNAIIVEKYDSVTGEALAGCTFQLRYLAGTSGTGGTVIGQKKTGPNGMCMWTGLNPGSYIVEEVDPADGYNIINASETVFLADDGEQSVVTVRFNNSPNGSLLIRKVCATNPSVTLQNAEFKVAYSDGTLIGDSNGIFRSDENGEVLIDDLKPGSSVVVSEVKAPAGFIIDSQSQTIQIKEGRTMSLTFKNQPKGKLIIQKRDSATNQPLPGAEFRVTTAAGCEVGLDGVIGTSTLTQNGIFTTDAQGEIRISNLAPGAYVLTEIKAPEGYVMDTTSTNVVIGQGGDTQTVVVKNSKAGSLVILKKSTDGKPLEGVEFKVTTSTGAFVPDANGHISSNGLYYTDKDGKITINGVVGTLVVTETKSIPGYTIDEATRTQTVDVRPNDTQTLHFYNKAATTVVIEKYIEGTTTPIKGVTFLVTDSSGAVIGNSNGEFITDEAGRIVLEGLEPGTTVTAKEIKALEGYELDTTPKSIKIKEGEVQTLRFYNKRLGSIVVRKLDKSSLEPLSGVEFQIVYSDGRYLDDDNGHLSSKGLYKTDSNGEIRISGVSGTLVITETKPLPGYVMDEGTRTQTVKVNPSDTQTITVYNIRAGGLTIIKKDEQTSERIPNVQMEVRKLNGEIIGTYTTDRNGMIQLPQAEKGWYEVVELKAAEGYRLDATPHRIEVKDGQQAVLEVTNRKAGSALIHKVDSLTGKGIFGVTFLVSDSRGNPIGTYQSDNEGYVFIDKELADGKYTVREIECADGYILDTQPKTFYVQYGGCTTITWPNTAMRGQIQIIKKSADYNSANGLPAGTPLAGATFEIYNERNGNKVDTIVSDRNGLASSKALPLGRYTIKETKAPANYGATSDTFTAVLEYSGQIVKLEITNKSVSTGVSIEKAGPKEAMRGQPVRYVFSGIGNTSNVTLQSFYWRDTLPAAVKPDKIVTGTYNFPGNYRIVYKVNNTGDYRTLADNLSTSKNYTLAASPVALGLAANERVTEIMFVFGQAPGGFSQVEAPMVYCVALLGLAPGSSFVNVADVGGTYNGVWLQAVTRWVTTVYGKPQKLPTTGY